MIKGKLIFLLSIAVMISSQARVCARSYGTIIGVVTDSRTDEPLDMVNVFLANTTIGDASDNEGKFILTRIPLGVYDLIFSRIGYEIKTLTVEIEAAKIMSLDIKLKSQIIDGEEIRVEAPDNKEWRSNLRRFKNIFLGESRLARRCDILNPYMLDFKTDSAGVFLAWSKDPLEIENAALGYRIKVYLNEFTWGKNGGLFAYYPFYEELEQGENLQKEKFRKARKEVYSGSLRQFFTELAKGSHLKNRFPFTLYEILNIGTSLKLAEKRVIHPSTLRILPLNDKLLTFRFWYNNRVLGVEDKKDKRLSMLLFMEDNIDFDSNGNVINARQQGVDGYWATLRLADALPNDYVAEAEE